MYTAQGWAPADSTLPQWLSFDVGRELDVDRIALYSYKVALGARSFALRTPKLPWRQDLDVTTSLPNAHLSD